VVLFHAGFWGTPGGFIGVDVFYVISGYLITSLLLMELQERGTIQLLDFWGRRMRRILPAGVLVLCFSLVGAAFVLPPLQLSRAAHDLPAAALYVINWRLAQKAVDYFAADAAPSLYLQYWSLAIEEQFYAVWPLIVLGVAILVVRFARGTAPARGVLWAATILSVMSFALSLYQTGQSGPYAFFGTFSRAWQLGLGGVISLLPALALSNLARRTMALVGFTAIVAAALLFTKETPYPGMAAIMPTFGTAAILVAGRVEAIGGVVDAGLKSPSLVLLGKWSYSWYLWHWPVLLLGSAIAGPANAFVLGLLVLLSLLLACLTYYLVEQPARRWPYLTRSPGRSVLAGLALSLGAAGFALLAQATFAQPRILLSTGVWLNAEAVRDDMSKDCLLSHEETRQEPCVFGDDPSSSRRVVIFGDSHAAALIPAIKLAAKKAGWQLLVRTKASCPSINVSVWSGFLKRPYTECDHWRANVLSELVTLDPELIVLANMAPGSPIDINAKRLAADDRRKALLEGEESMVTQLIEGTRARIVLVRDIVNAPQEPVSCLLENPGNEASCSWARRETAYPMGTYEGNPRIKVVDANNNICASGTCKAVLEGRVVMRDKHHLTASFAETLSPLFEALLNAQSQ